MKYNYILSSTNESSTKYGVCDVCKKHTTEVYHQIESKGYVRHDGTAGETYHECKNLFGHKECLESSRR